MGHAANVELAALANPLVALAGTAELAFS